MKNYNDASIQEIIEDWQVFRNGENIKFLKPNGIADNDALALMKSRKPEIIAHLLEVETEQEKAIATRKAKIAAIPGLKKLQETVCAWENYHVSWNRFMENDAIGIAPQKPHETTEEVSDSYPAAAAYIIAQNYSYSANYNKAQTGKKALNEIIENPTNHIEIIANMNQEWKQYCLKGKW